MGAKDGLSKLYMSDNRRFADLFNYHLFQGRKVIDPDELYVSDTVKTIVRETVANHQNETRRHRNRKVERIQDLNRLAIIKSDKAADYILLGLENESNIRYDMPVRTILSDALRYTDQVERLRRLHREKKDLSQDEYVSGISKNDKLKKVVTLILYLSSDPWTGPRRLYDLLEADDLGLERYVPDYRLNLIIPCEIEDFGKFSTELGTLLAVLNAAGSKEKFKKLVEEETELYSDVDKETSDMIEAFTNIKINRKEENTDMNICKGVQEWKEEIRAEGRAEGKAEGKAEGRAEGKAEGRAEGTLETLISLVKQGLISVSVAAGQLGETDEVFSKRL